MNLPSGVQFRTVAPMIINRLKLRDARSPLIERFCDLGSKNPKIGVARIMSQRQRGACQVQRPDSFWLVDSSGMKYSFCTSEDVAALNAPYAVPPESAVLWRLPNDHNTYHHESPAIATEVERVHRGGSTKCHRVTPSLVPRLACRGMSCVAQHTQHQLPLADCNCQG